MDTSCKKGKFGFSVKLPIIKMWPWLPWTELVYWAYDRVLVVFAKNESPTSEVRLRKSPSWDEHEVPQEVDYVPKAMMSALVEMDELCELVTPHVHEHWDGHEMVETGADEHLQQLCPASYLKTNSRQICVCRILFERLHESQSRQL